MKKLIPILLSALMFTGCAGTSNNQTNTYRSITMEEAVTMMAEESGYIILDVRRPDEFAAGHIPNAINVPNESIGTSEIPELPDKNQLIMVYCRSGRRSKEASEKLVKLGYTNIVEFGGILDWKGEIVKKDGAYDTEEGCLSLLGGPRKCRRYKTIKVQYQTLEMQTRTKNFTGWTAQIIQHEVDHCNGILI